VPGLNGYLVAIAGAASLWAAGVTLAQFPHLYRMLYAGDSMFSGDNEREMAQALAITAPLVVTIGTALMATALSRLAAFRGDAKLHTDAHSWGVGFVLLMLVAIAIQSWALPKAESLSSLAMMMLFAAAAGLFATILMARLLGSGADSLESDATLPTASVVSGPS
jgi:predicted Co/Zn/Cd cation transporter (cation efflux family)